MIEISLVAEDYSEVRFATSPVGEAVLSLRVLQDATRHALYLDWIRATVTRLEPGLLAELGRLVRPSGYIPDFLTPAPKETHPSVMAELETIARTSRAGILRDLEILMSDGVSTQELQFFLKQPRAALRSYVGLLRRYWDLALACHWPYIQSVLEGDIVRRAHTLATEGPGALFNSIHPAVTFDGARSLIRIQKRVRRRIEPAGAGLRLTPRMFAWPDVYVLEDPSPVSIAYPPRGLALWNQVAEDVERALAAALGRARARLLLELNVPVHVTALAHRLGVTKGAVSQQLSRLLEAGLVKAMGKGGYRYYYLSRRGEIVKRAFAGSGSR